VFGDDDPEDAWDASDPAPIKVAILIRWAWSVLLEHTYQPGPRPLKRAAACRHEAQALEGDDGLDATQLAALALVVWALRELT